ncbi:TetR family transcriptional regulator [Arthrobacter sp. MYb211]|uniref:TetR/AcrR family transcriptional regulator n=1 Tax=Micrococcaceae TaxID=1268 RepID=UPI000CFCAF83|nr:MULTISPECIES: TetR/AcrR family transcriptional regulator [unclassified Arthrobacter]PQZ98644.1 TetR family transcriptional regulator [Arthrobacter sp. MYb224]PRA02978.1 TetR family transcriptional regulator [Arthrobacter sp. MYb229]PRA11060.1 TetR family transcriptional regulator [Arthrobacter sp. MYb221]PRB49448.1 TetR family transcriptional regulator [Arthrobacter sp. MYb216]PRC07214.1 TetR family transcriptional regulator [Arthrobacter sp. MYb211]
MTTPPSGRPRVRATASKKRLFAASMQLLGARGPNAVSVDEIAQMAGVSKGTVYYNFGSKDEMIGQVLEFGADMLVAELDQAAAKPDPREALRAMATIAVEFVEKYPSFAQIWISEQLRPESDWGDQITPVYSRVTSTLIEVLDRLVILAPEEKQPAATAIFGAALFSARMRTVSDNVADREATLNAVLYSVDGLLATHQHVAS